MPVKNRETLLTASHSNQGTFKLQCFHLSCWKVGRLGNCWDSFKGLKSPYPKACLKFCLSSEAFSGKHSFLPVKSSKFRITSSLVFLTDLFLVEQSYYSYLWYCYDYIFTSDIKSQKKLRTKYFILPITNLYYNSVLSMLALYPVLF